MTFRKSGLTWIVLLLSVTLSGCISRWTEDVELGDGTIIKVTRTEKYGGGGGIGESCLFCTFEWARLSFEYNNNKFVWKSMELSEVPMVLDIVNGSPVVVSHSSTSICPKIPEKNKYSYYVYSVHDGSSWVRRFDGPSSTRKTRNLHWYKPGYASGLSIFDKALWVNSQVIGPTNYGKPNISIINDAESYCAPWR